VEIAADRGWQSTRIALKAGDKYELRAVGRFQVANKPKPWISEANGVSIRFVHGQPVGLLLGAIRPDDFDATLNRSPLAEPLQIGAATTLAPTTTGTLYLRINDAPGELADNVGKLAITIKPLPN
jgi:hypothetical protein